MTQNTIALPEGMQITGDIAPGYEQILTPAALALVAKLTREFEPRRQQLLAVRVERAKRLDAGERPDFLPETAHIRDGDWKIAPIPKALECRRVEITGPVERKMVINAFNSGADSYMTDFEDSNTPNWDNQITGQINMFDAVRKTISLEQNGKSYKLNDKIATLTCVRAAGTWMKSMCWSTASAFPAAFSISPCSCSITPRNSWRAAPARISTCRRWNRTWKRACGTISSS